MAKKDDLMNDDNEVKVPFAKWDKIGKSYKGVYVARRISPNSLRPGENQVVYTLAEAVERPDEGAEEIAVEGGLLNISGRSNQNPAVMPQLELCKLGQVVALKYTEQREPKKAGFNGAKVIRVYTKKEMNPEVLAAFTMGGEVEDGGLPPVGEEN